MLKTERSLLLLIVQGSGKAFLCMFVEKVLRGGLKAMAPSVGVISKLPWVCFRSLLTTLWK